VHIFYSNIVHIPVDDIVDFLLHWLHELESLTEKQRTELREEGWKDDS
jgi:hypothetical protein